MGSEGMAMMGEMEMPMPYNTLMMMTGTGQFGPIEMGGMFTVMKVREGLAPNDYKDPGPYKNPPGTIAYEVDANAAGEPPRQPAPSESPGKEMPGMDMPGMEMPGMDMPGMNMPGMKPGGHQGHH
jgi:manganese oxidase